MANKAGKEATENSGKAGGKGAKNSGKSKKKISKKQRGIICFVVLSIVVAGYLFGLTIENKIDNALGLRVVETYEAGDVVAIGALNIHFIDVGQGDSCLIELPDNRTMLIDAGENKSSVRKSITNYIDDVNDIREAESRPQITYFDFLIATHSDSDHIGSMAYIIGLYPPKIFYRPNEQATYTGYRDPALDGTEKNGFWGSSHGEKDTITYKNTIEAGFNASDEMIITNPADNTQNRIVPQLASTHNLYYEINFYGHTSSSYNDHNNYSPIIIIEYKGRRIALSGDCEQKGEQEFVALATAGVDERYDIFDNSFKVDIIKLGHHGSRTSSRDDYLAVLTKGTDISLVYAVISCGAGNSYGHPHAEVFQKGFASDKIMRTDEDGSMMFSLVYTESGDALVMFKGNISPNVTYPVKIFGIEIRYRIIGLAIVAVVAVILLLNGLKKSDLKKIKKKLFN